MRTTLTLDDDTMADAIAYSGMDDKSKLINLALEEYVKRMAAKRLVALGGTMPDLAVPARNSSRLADDVSPAREAARSLVTLGGTMPELDLPSRHDFERDESNFAKVGEDPAEYRITKPKDLEP